MNRYRIFICCIAAVFLTMCIAAAPAEVPQEDTEQGLDEIQSLLEMTEAEEEKEGMSLEEMTEAFSASAMSEYYDSLTGFSMQYPSIFLFDEDFQGISAVTGDGKATMTVDNMENMSGLDETALKAAIELEIPNAEIQKNQQNGCLRVDRITDEGKTGQTDLYLLTEKSFHHIVICYPAAEKETYISYIEYMINTMETKDTDLG